MDRDTLTIRRATPADLGAVDALLSRSYPTLLKADYPPSVLVTALPLISRAQPRLLASGSYFVATDPQGGVVAAGGWTKAAPQGPAGPRGLAHIRHVVTDHRRTREGIGRRLMGRIFETAGQVGIRRLDCQSTRTAVPFYAACGFSRIAEFEIELRPGIWFPAVRMVKTLPPSHPV